MPKTIRKSKNNTLKKVTTTHMNQFSFHTVITQEIKIIKIGHIYKEAVHRKIKSNFYNLTLQTIKKHLKHKIS